MLDSSNFNVVVDTTNLTRQQWLEYRKKGIGGSDAGAIVGLNDYATAVDVYIDKINRKKGLEESDSERLKQGRDLEEYVVKRFIEETGKEVVERNQLMQHKEYDFMFANIDRELVNENAILECKTSAYPNKWEQEAIPSYVIQCHHYMAVTGADKAYLYVVFLGTNTPPKLYTIERDEEIIESLISVEGEFWNNNILKKELPQPDGSDSYKDMLNDKFSDVKDETINLDEGFFDKADRVKQLKKTIDELTVDMKKLQQEIQSEMKENKRAVMDRADKDYYYNASWSKVEGKKVFNEKEFKEQNPEMWEEYKTKEKNGYRRMIITLKEKEKINE